MGETRWNGPGPHLASKSRRIRVTSPECTPFVRMSHAGKEKRAYDRTTRSVLALAIVRECRIATISTRRFGIEFDGWAGVFFHAIFGDTKLRKGIPCILRQASGNEDLPWPSRDRRELSGCCRPGNHRPACPMGTELPIHASANYDRDSMGKGASR